ELMVPAGAVVPGKHGTWGSPPVSLSRDYPRLRELVHGDGWGPDRDRPRRLAGLFGDDTPGEPAIDRVDLRLEYLLWFVNPQQIPALVTTSTTPGGLGFLGQPGTQTLLGPGEFGDALRNGFRVRGGYWFQECGSGGVDGSFFFLGRQTERRSFDGNAIPTLTRPFFAPNDGGMEFGEIVSLPGFAQGRLDIEANSYLWGFDANLRHALCKRCDFRQEVFAGYRFLGLNEDLTINETITSLAGNPADPPGTRVFVQDQFRTRNRFNGGQLGYAAERNWGRLSLDGRASVALGNTRQVLDIAGSQVVQRPGEAPQRFVGGLLATGPNLGHFERDRFSVVPEATVNLGVWITPTFKAYVGYNFLYWSNVIRPGDQIDRVVDVTLIPNPPTDPTGRVPPFSGQFRPRPTFKEDNLSIHGLQFGVEWRW
ncbi:MAG: BBP7 family outer membrane beta-barrel protein, partial [Gemmataceae bacterium]|nr:BBP7 family outer membrane beta-barrel protein [Gemmataceae bacterium]